MQKPVLFRVTNNLKIGGIQRRLRTLLPRLIADFEVHVITYRKKGVFWHELADLGVQTHFMPFRGKWSPTGIYRLSRIFKRFHADIVHTHSLGGNISGILAAALAGVSVKIGNVHHRGVHWYASNPIHKHKQMLQEKYVHRYFSDKVLFVSQESMEYFQTQTHLSKDKLILLHNGFDFEAMTAKHEAAAIRKKLQIPSSKKIVGFVGRLTQGKGISYFMDYAKSVLSATQAYVFVVVGGGGPPPFTGIQKEEKYGANNPNIIFTGEQRDVYEYYNIFDCFLFPSDAEWEGMPGAVLEACAFGLPILSRRNRPVEEIAAYYPNILFLDSHTPPVDMLDKALSLPKADLRPFRREFSIETMAARTKALYLDLLEKNSLSPK